MVPIFSVMAVFVGAWLLGFWATLTLSTDKQELPGFAVAVRATVFATGFSIAFAGVVSAILH
jgi:hypothetical protein